MSALTGMSNTQKPPSTRRKLLLWAGPAFLLVLASLAGLFICRLQAEKAEKEILASQQQIQQALLDKSLAAIALWRSRLQQQASAASSQPLFASFVLNMSQHNEAALTRLNDPQSVQDADEGLRAKAGQLASVQNLLKEFSRLYGWNLARIVRPDGSVLAEADLAPNLSREEQSLASLACESGRAAFGPLYKEKAALLLDMAEPLPAESGARAAKPLAALLLSLPVEKVLSGILAERGEGPLLRIASQGEHGFFMLLAKDGRIVQEAVTPTLGEALEQESLPFGRRESLDGSRQVYSLGARSDMEDWRMVLETPASLPESQIASQRLQIYGLGGAAIFCIALLMALFAVKASDRSHLSRVRHLEMLNATISNQKALLDSVNASLHAGLALVDSEGRILMANRAFCALAGEKDEIPWGTPLVEVLPGKVAVRLLSDMAIVHACGQWATVEIELPCAEFPAKAASECRHEDVKTRLFRVSLSPYGADDKKGAPGNAGCVAIFQDITSARQNAERARLRQTALIAALVRAIESVDPNLTGHSDKMARAACLVADELNLDPHEKETLDMAARLSQIGKIFVPRELLTKREALTPGERQEVLRAPEHADAVLHDLRFDLPVRETVREMGERMDGSGSPHGLQGEEISRCGRVLAVINAYVAMTSPRAWRDNIGMSPDEALRQLALDLRFDQTVVSALACVLGIALARDKAASAEASSS